MPTPTSPSPSATTPTTAPYVCNIPSGFRGKDLEVLPTSRNVVALTFDGGSGAAGVPSILATLAERKVPATFFLTGRFVELFPGKAARIGRRHLVGNHTRTHPHLTTFTNKQVRAEIGSAQRMLRETTGQDPRRFFRFPYGERDVRTLGVVNSMCYVAFRWTVDTLGWKGPKAGITPAVVVDRVTDAAKPGAIVLMHVGEAEDGSTVDADALPDVIDVLQARGYGFVRLSAVMSAAP
jgi:peptidoglycan/xylan/chitin deacetylase (PgdA/CDA1 family)